MSVTETVASPTLAEFWDQLNSHDWYHAWSDDHRVWQRGNSNYKRLQSIAAFSGEEYTELLSAFSAHYFSGDPWNTEKQPKPERPSD